ncbi:TPA: hypothetical protein HA251_03505 [Candidatus Woesearchaeota archaeon]|nr:hypothetical protein [Candidatus Woesearchaeota archaeon]
MVKAYSPTPVENPFERYGIYGKRSPVQLGTGLVASVLSASIVFGIPAYHNARMPSRPAQYSQYENATLTLSLLEKKLELTTQEGLDVKLPYKNDAVQKFLEHQTKSETLRAAMNSVEEDVTRMRTDSKILEYETADAQLQMTKRRLAPYAIGSTMITVLLGMGLDEWLRRRKRRNA